MDYNRKALNLHKKLAGKIKISSKVPIKNRDDLSSVYTPGVGAVSTAIAKNKNLVWELTGKGNSVAIVTDGTAVLGLGNVGPEAALPVMEGKSVLFSEFGNVNAMPLCISTNLPEEMVNFVKMISPGFGGINLEDIGAPNCFEIEEKLRGLEIPVFHDDQDGAAIVVLSALLNAVKVTGKNFAKLKVVILGAGAAGAATAWLLSGREKWQAPKKVHPFWYNPPTNIILVDSKGIIDERRANLNEWKKMLASVTNKSRLAGGLDLALKGADVVIGLSTGGKITKKQISLMNKNPIVFALSNPNPEIKPSDAYDGGAAIVATGRSDYPNQVNNALVFPGLFRGLLDARAATVTPTIKYEVARTIAEYITPVKNNILPSILDKNLHLKVAQTVRKFANHIP